MTRLWLLDFDGTLVDSEKVIKACYQKIGYELVPERCAFISTMVIGPTLDESSRMILTDNNLHLLDTFKNKFQQLYDDKLVLETPQYPKVDMTLRKLHSQGDTLAIVTNKRTYPTLKLIDHYDWHHLFDWVACMDEYPSAQSKSELISIKNINRKQYDGIFFVGDTITDYRAAETHSIPFIKASYGYGLKENWENKKIKKNIDSFDELLKI
jgi:phosphoglycolate phosphatase